MDDSELEAIQAQITAAKAELRRVQDEGISASQEATSTLVSKSVELADVENAVKVRFVRALNPFFDPGLERRLLSNS